MEFHFIKQYDTYNNGYNSTSGGDFDYKVTKEARKNISEAAKNRKYSKKAIERFKTMNKGKDNGMYGKKHSEETKKKLSEKGKIHNKGERNPMYGKLGKNNPNYSKGNEGRWWLITYPDGKEIEINCLSSFGRDYEKETGIKLFTSNLTNVASGKVKHYKGFKCKNLTC